MLPHDEVYTRLGVSNIHGIGVFAISNIEKGIMLFKYDTAEMVWVDVNETKYLSEKLKQFYEDFCVLNNDKTFYGCPANFNQLTMAWYMNHSDNPNVEADKNYDFHTIRKISEGEELTINYNNFIK